MTRQLLGNRRAALTFDVKHGDLAGSVTVSAGFYPDGRIAEVFINGRKVGSEAAGIARDFAVVMSIALQHGATIDEIRHALTRNADGSPQTIAGTVADALKPICSAHLLTTEGDSR
jgi:hypothetical protein